MSVELAMENAKLESEVRNTRYVSHQLRKFLAGALCTFCGDPLGTEEEIVQNDDEETMHKRCEDSIALAKGEA